MAENEISKAIFFEKKGSSVPSPDEKEKSQGSRKIFTWGQNNDYPQWLNGLFRNNAIHSGIIRSKVHYTVSGGLTYEGDENDQEDLLKWEQMLSNGVSEFDLNEVSEQMSLDYEISNKFILRGKWNLAYTGVEKLELLDYEKVRKVVGSTDVIWCSDWTDKKSTVKTYKLLNLKLKGSVPESGTRREREFYIEFEERSKQAIGKDTKKANKGIYPDPPYSGGIKSVCTGIEIDEYQNAEVINGFSLGTIINFNNGEPRNKKDKEDLLKGLRAASTGSSQAGGVLGLFNNGKDREASVVSLNGNDLNKRYIELNKDTQKNILRAHSVTTPILFGFKEEGSLGNATELQIGYSIMKANYFKSRQDSLLSVLNFIGKKCNGLKADIIFADVSLDLESNAPEDGGEVAQAINEMSPLVANKVLTQMTPNEVRSLGRLVALEGGDVLPVVDEVIETLTKVEMRSMAKILMRSENKPKSIKDVFDEIQADREETLLTALGSKGSSRSDNKILYRSEVTDSENVSEQKCLEAFGKERFIDLSDDTQQVLNQISNGVDFTSIKKALDFTSRKLAGIYQDLISKDLISKEGVLTDAGIDQVAQSQAESLEILYSYELRTDAPALQPGGESRPFCLALIALDRLYTRAEIDSISAIEGYDVFSFKGGWYHDPDTDQNEPFCRHTWTQNVVFNT